MFRRVLPLLVGFSCWGAQVQIAWDPNSESNLAGYRLYVYGNGATNVVALGKVTSVTYSNLVVGQTYDFDLTAFNTAGLESPHSEKVSVTVSNSAMLVVFGYSFKTNRFVP